MYGIIYKITNKINRYIYIGQTIHSLDCRWKNHIRAANRGSKVYFHKAIKKYGKDNFIVEQIAEANSKEELNKLEINLIKQYDCLAPNGYNTSTGGEGGNNFCNNPNIALIKKHMSEGRQNYFKSKKWIEEDRKICSEHHREAALNPNGIIQSKKYKEKMRTICIGRKHSKATREKMSKIQLGKEIPKDARKRQSSIRKNRYLGYHWWNDGQDQKFCKECPGKDWIKGRLNAHWNQRNYKIYCIELDKIFNNYVEAANFICKNYDDLDLTKRRISRACNGKYEKAFDYHWKLILK